MDKNGLKDKLIGRLGTVNEKKAVTNLEKVNEVAITLGAEEILFCIGKLSYRQVFHYASTVKIPLRLRFHAMGSCSIVGSDSVASNGETITSESNFNLDQPNNKRLKRLIDIVASCILLIFLPIHFLFVKQPIGLFKNGIAVLVGKKTWTGYDGTYSSSLPLLRKPVINTHSMGNAENDSRIDYWYAKNYEPLHDIRLIVKNYKHLGG
jgi:hypothetical protein